MNMETPIGLFKEIIKQNKDYMKCPRSKCSENLVITQLSNGVKIYTCEVCKKVDRKL